MPRPLHQEGAEPAAPIPVPSLLRGDEEALEEGDAERQGAEPAPPARRHYGPAAITRPPRPAAHAPERGVRGGAGEVMAVLGGTGRGWQCSSWLHTAPHKNKILCLRAVSKCSLKSFRLGAVSTALGRLSQCTTTLTSP